MIEFLYSGTSGRDCNLDFPVAINSGITSDQLVSFSGADWVARLGHLSILRMSPVVVKAMDQQVVHQRIDREAQWGGITEDRRWTVTDEATQNAALRLVLDAISESSW
jgi:hypothetical protein